MVIVMLLCHAALTLDILLEPLAGVRYPARQHRARLGLVPLAGHRGGEAQRGRCCGSRARHPLVPRDNLCTAPKTLLPGFVRRANFRRIAAW